MPHAAQVGRSRRPTAKPSEKGSSLQVDTKLGASLRKARTCQAAGLAEAKAQREDAGQAWVQVASGWLWLSREVLLT